MLEKIVTVVNPINYGISRIKTAPDGLPLRFGVSFYVFLAGSYTLHGGMSVVESIGSEAGTTLGEVGVEVEEAIMTPHRRTTTTPRLHTESQLPAQAKKHGDPGSGLELLAVWLRDIWQGIGKTRLKQGTQAILAINVTTMVVF